MDAQPASARQRRPLRTLLGGRRKRHIETQGRAIAEHLKQALLSPGSGNPTGQINQLRTTLQALRHEVLRNGAGAHTHLVADALHDLDESLASLTRSVESTDPNTKLQLVARSKHRLDEAQRKATAAGHDWPL